LVKALEFALCHCIRAIGALYSARVPSDDATGDTTMDFASARQNMVENQIRPNRVTDPLVLSAMAELPREAFVPKTLQDIAYVDEGIALGGGRYLMEPMVLALLLQAAEVRPTDVVLDIGCGPGYAAAVLARMASTVVALESDPALAARATATLAELGIDTVAVVEGPLEKGYPKQAPYDVIYFGGAFSRIPPVITDQLAEAGRLVALAAGDGVGKGTVVARYAGVLSRREVFDAGTPCLPGFSPAPTFTF